MAAKKEASKATKKASSKKAEGGKTSKTAKSSTKAKKDGAGAGKSASKAESKSKKKEAKSGRSSKTKGAAASKARVYQPHEVYQVGELIKHPVWNDEGTITSVAETPDGIPCIVVDFGERGTKRLVVDYSLKI